MRLFPVQVVTTLLLFVPLTDMDEESIDGDTGATMGSPVIEFESGGTVAPPIVDLAQLAVNEAIKRLDKLGDFRPDDDEESVGLKMDAMFALGDALIEAGAGWDDERIAREIAIIRGYREPSA